MGYPGHMSELIRTKSGEFHLKDCYDLEELEEGKYKLLSLEEAFCSFEQYVVDDENIVYHGKLIKSDIDHQVVIVNKSGQVLAVYGPNGKGYLKSIRGLF